jgi:hypothetical protein
MQMPEAVVEPTESLGWRAGLPGDLQQNDTFKQFKTVGDFAKSHLEISAKATELAKKLEDYVPKLPDNATDAEKALYYDALGRPKQPSEYKFDGEDKNASEWNNAWKQKFHSIGLTKAQGETLSKEFNATIQQIVDAHNESLKNEYKTAEAALRSEYGDKFDTNLELAKRLYQKHIGKEFDKDFDNTTDKARLAMIRMIVKFAEKTGEDQSPQGTQRPTVKGVDNPYPKSQMPPARITGFPVIA